MIVSEAIEFLETLDPNAIIILARDPEGSYYAPLEEMSEGYFNSKTSEFFQEDEFFNDEESGPQFEETEAFDSVPHGIPAVAIWPAF